MTSPEARKSAAPALDFSATKAAVWLSVTAFMNSRTTPATCSASPATDPWEAVAQWKNE